MNRFRRILGLAAAVAALALTACAAPAEKLDADNLPDLAANRARMIAWLGEYRAAGQFPVNLADHTQPIFMDDEGRLCAVAYLMTRSGYGDVVQHLATTNNNAFVADLADGPLAPWIRISGLTLDEIVGIQEPAYRAMEPVASDPAAMRVAVDDDRARIQARLATVIADLDANTTVSLRIAVSGLDDAQGVQTRGTSKSRD